MKSILAKLINQLIKNGSIDEALEINDVLFELIDEENEACDTDPIANIVGLRDDVKPEQPIGGIAVEPFFYM